MKEGDLVYRIYLTGEMVNKKISGPHKVLEKLKGERFMIENHDYAIPSYQSKVVPNRPREISMVNPYETRTLSNNIDHSKFSVNDLIAHEVSIEINRIDVSQVNFIDYEHKILKCTSFWCDIGSQTWNSRECEHLYIAYNQVIYHPLRLLKGKIPKNVQRTLLNYCFIQGGLVLCIHQYYLYTYQEIHLLNLSYVGVAMLTTQHMEKSNEKI